VIAADTNILVRAIVGDDPAQTELARRWMSAHQDGGIFVDHIVLVELTWVLRARYAQPRAEIAKVLELLLGTGGIVVPEEQLVRNALTAFKAGRGDFADHLIRERASARGFAPLATFDESLLGLRGYAKVRGA
jgi:predicted nucleic-acid-binding protein